jgi:hypothetical protein
MAAKRPTRKPAAPAAPKPKHSPAKPTPAPVAPASVPTPGRIRPGSSRALEAAGRRRRD